VPGRDAIDGAHDQRTFEENRVSTGTPGHRPKGMSRPLEAAPSGSCHVPYGATNLTDAVLPDGPPTAATLWLGADAPSHTAQKSASPTGCSFAL
jgi:hypothetical protein